MKRVLITGAGGYIGAQLGASLAARHRVTGLDLHCPEGLAFECVAGDIRDPDLVDLMRARHIDSVVHLAAILDSSGDTARDYDIDVNGTRNVLEACVGAGVGHLVVLSSGAAYGYHADNPEWLDENDALRGNDAFPYARHKRLVEELLAGYRQQHPGLRQLVLRPGTVLGADTRNQITALFARKRLLAVSGSASPFVFIWDQDVVRIIERGIDRGAAGIFNLAGDGALTMPQLAAILGKPVRTLPAAVLRLGLTLGHALGWTRHAPAQLDFLRYRPVLSNRRLKQEFGYVPAKTSEDVFRFFVQHARERGEL